MYFSGNVAFSSLPVFLPTILFQMGFSSVNAQGLTAPPFFLSFLLTIATTYVADRTQQRGFMVATLTAIGGIGYVILATSKSVGARYFGVFLAAGGIFPAIGNVLPWVTNNQGSDTRRGAGIAVLNRKVNRKLTNLINMLMFYSYWPVWAASWNSPISRQRKTIFCKRPVSMCSIHVLLLLSVASTTGSAGLGEQKARSRAWDLSGAEASHGRSGVERRSQERSRVGELWAAVPICFVNKSCL